MSATAGPDRAEQRRQAQVATGSPRLNQSPVTSCRVCADGGDRPSDCPCGLDRDTGLATCTSPEHGRGAAVGTEGKWLHETTTRCGCGVDHAARSTAPAAERQPLKTALALADRGYRVFPNHTPIFTAEEVRCSCNKSSCEDIGKHPRTMHGVSDATSDPEQIEEWWRMWPDANLAIATGDPVSVLDVDPRHGGDETLHDLEQQYGALPITVTVQTGGGGQHHWFTTPEGSEIRNSAGQVGPGLDIRGAGGYALVPPSLHASGRHYTWTS